LTQAAHDMSEPGLELLSGHREPERNVSAMSEAEWDAMSDDPKADREARYDRVDD
jgi:hypothetical protein